MTNYDYQYEIFKMMSKIYPIKQMNEVETYLKKLWKMDAQKLKNEYDLWREITNA